IAGLLGVSYDDLRQRELVRRNRRLMIIAVASALGMAVTATLAGMALLARDDAERRRLQAEGLVGFMLGDLYERLYEIGRVDIYNAIGDQATAYFQSMEKDDLTDTALAQRSESLRQIGETRADQGQLDAALEAFELALELSEGVTTRQPDRIDWRLGLAETHYWIGYVGWRRGDLDVAAAGFEKQLQVQEAVLAGGAESAELVREMGYAYTNLGRVEEGRGRFELALTHYLRVLELNQRYAQMDPDNADALLEIGFANNNLGVLLMRMGRLETAEGYFREDLAIKQKVAANEPGNGLWGDYVSTSEYFLGQILENRGAVDEALEHHKAAEAGAGRLFEESRANDARARGFANALRQTADLSMRIGEYGPAATRLEEALAILSSRRGDHQDDTRWLRDLARAQIAAGRLALMTGDLSLAETRSAEADAILLELLALSPDSVEFQHAYMTGLLLQGDIKRAAGDETAAAWIWSQLAADMAVQVTDSRDPEWLAPYAGTLIRLGRTKEAVPYTERLREMGYARPGPELSLAGEP
ncbi:MAG: tetratricopeptide repeat protein, partial [Gammaproteobacteria bacterium]